jgi:hypothetical protein
MWFTRGKLFFPLLPCLPPSHQMRCAFIPHSEFSPQSIGPPGGESQETAAAVIARPRKFKRDCIYSRRAIF